MMVSIIIPAYKQEKSIKRNIEDIHSVLSETSWDFEIIVVVDGYVDDTFEEASKIIKENVHVIGYAQNQGKGFAVKYGMAQAMGDLVAFIDAGLDISSKGIERLLEIMEEDDADIVVGSKRHPDSSGEYPFLRRVYSWVYYSMVRLLFGVKVSDTQVGLKVYKREVLDNVLPRLIIKEFAFDIEMLAVARRLGFNKVSEAPVDIKLDFTDTSFTKTVLLDPYIQKMIIDTLAVFYRLKILRYYDDKNSYKWLQNEIAHLMSASIELPKIHSPSFSIIIPARAISDYLLENIKHLKRLSYQNFEVIMIFDVSIEAPEDWGDQFRVLDNVGNKSPGEKRNMGASVADGNILVFLDDDAYPHSDWLDYAVDIFVNTDTFALGGPAVTPKDAQFAERLAGRLLESALVSGNTIFRHRPGSPRKIDDYPTVNLFVRKDAFMDVGGFTTEFWPGEDTKLCLDLVTKYRKMFLYDPRPIVFHHRRDGLLPHLKQVSRFGRHRGQFAKIFPQTSRVIGYFIPSLFVLGLIGGPFISSIFPVLWPTYFFVVSIYVFLTLQRAIRVVMDEKNLYAGLFILVGIFLTHLVYGINFIIGLIRRPTLELKPVDSTTGNYLGG
jgi:glycosyltransferase involved in cell wall biosynthesis